jgi:tetratricopeptide (TPR) repeat protein
MTDHCFISYSTADALEFARQLADELEGGEDKTVKTWFDKRDIDPARDWDDQIVAGIRSCKCMLFVMTKDSTAQGSMCKNEWNWALRYKKPLVPIRLHKEAEQPFGLGNRQWIDFTGDFKQGLAKLRLFLRHMDTPEGQLEALNDRLSDADRDLRRAQPAETARIQTEIDDLKAKIKRQEEIVRDPEAARKQTEANIQSGLERERQPEKPVAGKATTRFINPPPGVAPTYFQDRTAETREVARFLRDDSQRLLTIVGRGGLGKTAMVCRLLKALEGGALPDGLGDLKVDGIVYLSESGSHRVNFANIFAGLSQLLPAESAAALETLYRDPQASPAAKMSALLERFPDGKTLLLLDNLEPLIDVETFAIGDAELDESLCAFLHGAHSGLKIILTTRIAPRALNLCEPGRQRVLPLDGGLETPYAENILREMDADGRLGLKTAPDALLARAREATRGYPRALEALFAILASDRYTSLEEILAAAGQALPENVIQSLVGEAFSRLDGEAQQVMQALAVYNRPVAPAAVDYLLQPRAPGINSAATLNRLVTMQFARRESGRYYLHPVDREYAFNIIPEGEKDLVSEIAENLEDDTFSSFSLPPLPPLSSASDDLDNDTNSSFSLPPLPPLSSAFGGSDNDADDDSGDDDEIDFENYFNDFREPREDFTRYGLLDRAADYFARARKPREEWKKLEDLAAQLAEFDLRCEAGDYDTAASVLIEIDYDYLLLWGHYRLMIDLHLRVKDKLTDKTLRMSNLNGLGLAHRSIGKVKESIDFFQQGLETTREATDRGWGGAFLGNLGNAYANLGEARKAIEFYEQALGIAREIGDREGEGTELSNLGNRYAELGETRKAIEFYEQALVIFREIDARKGEGIVLGNLFDVFIDVGEIDNAIQSAQKGLEIINEIGMPPTYEFGYLSLAYLLRNNLASARINIEKALQYDEPANNHNVSVLHGIIALRQGERGSAQAAFAQSIAQADELLAKTPDFYDALDAKGLAMCGSAVSREWRVESSKERDEVIAEAVEAFRAARKIACHAGVVKRVLRLFDELAKCDADGVLVEARKAAEGIP